MCICVGFTELLRLFKEKTISKISDYDSTGWNRIRICDLAICNNSGKPIAQWYITSIVISIVLLLTQIEWNTNIHPTHIINCLKCPVRQRLNLASAIKENPSLI